MTSDLLDKLQVNREDHGDRKIVIIGEHGEWWNDVEIVPSSNDLLILKLKREGVTEPYPAFPVAR